MGVHLAMLLSKQGNDVFVTTRKDRMNNAGIIRSSIVSSPIISRLTDWASLSISSCRRI